MGGNEEEERGNLYTAQRNSLLNVNGAYLFYQAGKSSFGA